MEEFLQHRSNLNTIILSGKKAHVYEDHRCILNVLKFYNEFKDVGQAINIVYFDFHDDAYSNPKFNKVDQVRRIKALSYREFYDHVEFEQSNQDDDWLISGMNYGLINNAINFLGKELNHLKEYGELYIDPLGVEHKLGYVNMEEQSKNAESVLDEIMKQEFILDIDLDFLTTEKNGKTIALNSDQIHNLFEEKILQDQSLNQLMKSLIQNSKFITICMESSCCSGFHNSARFLNYLNSKFFDSQLNEIC